VADGAETIQRFNVEAIVKALESANREVA